MPTLSGLQRIADRDKEELLLKLLDSLGEAQTTKTNRTCVRKFRQKLQQKRAAKRGKKRATAQDPSEKPSWSSSETEQDLSTADRLEHSYRCVPRILCAGTRVNAVQDPPKEHCLKDIEELLGPYWYLVPGFPLKGGRIYIARVLSYILLRHVSLMDIKKWFFIPNSGKMSVAEELLMELREKGVTWPPNVAGFHQCKTYNLGKSPSIQEWASAATPSTAVVDPNFGAHLAFVPHGFASLCPETPCILSELGEASSSSNSSSDSHSLQHTAMPFPEGPANMLTDADHMQHWPVPTDCMLPPWEQDAALDLPSISSVGTHLEMYGSGVSSGEFILADLQQ